MNERESIIVEQSKNQKKVSIGVLAFAILLAFVAGNRFQTIGDYFFAPYTNKGNQTLSQNLDYSSVEKVYDLLKQKYDGKLDTQKMQDGLNQGLVEAAGDPYTVYMSEKEATEFQNDLDGTFSGIGAELGKRNDALVVIAPIEDSPAKKAGLRSGDVIVKINDDETAGLSVDAAVNKIRGEAGTDVKLSLIRGDSPLELTITRAQITVPSVKSEILEGNIGYLQITRFSDDTAQLASAAAQEFKSKNVKGIVLDVRNDGGGLLDAAVKVAGLWLNNQVVVIEKQGGKTTAELRTSNNPPLAGIPTTMLINEGSASASEILAGALHDHGAAKLIGKKSFGKGSVQELIDLPNGGKLKVTVARWYTPNGKNIDKEGIKPDIEVDLSAEDSNNNRDPQKDRAIAEIK
jgi:carboxyl-terminal processing protease